MYIISGNIVGISVDLNKNIYFFHMFIFINLNILFNSFKMSESVSLIEQIQNCKSYYLAFSLF